MFNAFNISEYEYLPYESPIRKAIEIKNLRWTLLMEVICTSQNGFQSKDAQSTTNKATVQNFQGIHREIRTGSKNKML